MSVLIRYREWSRQARGTTPQSHPIGATKGVTLHWEGPHMGSFAHRECADHVRGIQRYHREGRGWADIAYNAIVCPHGFIFEGRGAGVRSAANGNEGDNDDWYAVCYLGGERDPFTVAAKQGFIEAVHWLREKGNAGPAVNGHRDHKATECPGDDIYRWLHARDWTITNEEENDMTPTQIATLNKAATDAAAAKRLSGLARDRGLINTRLLLRIASQVGIVSEDIKDIEAALAALDAEDSA